MIDNSRNKADLSVHTVHTPSGLTKQRLTRLPHVKNAPTSGGFGAMLRSHVAPSPPIHEEV